MLSLWHSPIYTDGLDPSVRFPRERYDLVRSSLLSAESEGSIVFRTPERLDDLDLLYRVHDKAYVDRFLSGSLGEDELRRIGLRPWTDRMVERTLILTNGTIEATRQAVANRSIAGNLGGGTHHAYHDFGSGYCIVNDLAISARVAQHELGVGRVLVLDLDVHQGDGTASIFEDDPSVYTASFHCEANFPARKMESDFDLPLPKGTTDALFVSDLRRFLDDHFRKFSPDLVFYQAGVDGLGTDRLGHFSLSREGLRERNEMVFEAARAMQIPLVVTMGGGYSEPIDRSVEAHTDLFLQAAGAPFSILE